MTYFNVILRIKDFSSEFVLTSAIDHVSILYFYLIFVSHSLYCELGFKFLTEHGFRPHLLPSEAM